MLLAVLAAVVGLNCLDPAAMQQAWNPGIQAFERGDMAAAKANRDWIAGEVLATELLIDGPTAGQAEQVDGRELFIDLAKSGAPG